MYNPRSNINYYQNALNIQVPFPTSTKADEIIELQIKNGIKSINQTMNAFMIEFNNVVTNYNLELKDISLCASVSWKQGPQYVKKYYKQLAKRVKELFKEKVSSLYIIQNKQVSSTIGNNVSFNSPFPKMNQNFSSPLDDRNSPSPYVTCSNYPLPNMNTFVSDNFENSLHTYMTIYDDKLINYISEDLALTYRAIVHSLPF
ncbi:785_t:CDS:1 [Diversispora eburnea]|uniref:785_t:CDS:1 n=1 Tax=Diversispora eburnea TaxID=1213867 RepID=A0A9N9CMB3_9GLOM|nr:785_t:CDS:1 [Diversispora eburnea]